MSGFDILYNNMHRNFPKTAKSNDADVKNSATDEGRDSKKSESSSNPLKALLSKIF